MLFRSILLLFGLLMLASCKHPLAIVGDGDIVERLSGARGCTLEEYQSQSSRCADNTALDGDYVVSYEAVPRPGWTFVGWEGTACGGESRAPYCEFDVDESLVGLTNTTWPGFAVAETVAVFRRDADQAAFAHYQERVVDEVLNARCAVCHVPGGVSGHTGLVFQRSSEPLADEKNFAVFQQYIAGYQTGAETLLSKVHGGSGHGGGSIFSAASEEYQSLEEFIAMLQAEDDLGTADFLAEFWKDTALSSNSATLRRAAIIFAGRVPTTQEYLLAAGDEEALRTAIASLFQGEGFHQFLTRGANDRLHTMGFMNGLSFPLTEFASQGFYPIPGVRWYNWDESTQASINARWTWLGDIQRGLSRAPGELIAYVVEQNRPYTEILTANYTMVNVHTNEIFRSGLSFLSSDASVYKPGQNRGQVLADDNRQLEFEPANGAFRWDSWGDYVEYPHAGVLNTLAFLSRYPTTETNRNRARARWTYYHFLGVDIEKAAGRTADPVALADTHNPTLNNSACAVCHTLMDPVAGLYQNYGNEGYYRDANGGLDALPDTYKYPEEFDANAEASLYEWGDVWYRTMREPGFTGRTPPIAGRSLPWLGRQITSDKRFAEASVRFWWPAIIGSPVLEPPAILTVPDYQQKRRAYDAQQLAISELARGFAEGFDGGEPLNARELFVEIALTPWFRLGAVNETFDRDRSSELATAGTRRLLTPEELDQKTKALLGEAWGEHRDVAWKSGLNASNLSDFYTVTYGGIDSVGVRQRARQMTSVMSNIIEQMVMQFSCPIVAADFGRNNSERKLFAGIEQTTTPGLALGSTYIAGTGEAEIRAKLVELHRILLGEELTVDSAEIDASLSLLVEVWLERRSQGLNTAWNNGTQEDCFWNKGIWGDSPTWQLNSDPQGMKRAWMSVIAYLMSDFRYLHE